MESMMPYIWIAMIVLSVAVESASMALTAIWFLPGGIVSMILAFCDVPIWIQIIVYIVLAALCLILFKPFVKRFQRKSDHFKTNVESLIGETAVVIEDIDNIHETGAVKLRGLVWTARSERDNDELIKGDVVEILSVSGVKLICKKK
jgi:membrane protein implicated in regulation of membrane protease activity